MKSRRATLYIPGSNDTTRLREFTNDIYNNPMYETVMITLRETAGFVQKSSSIIESKDRVSMISEVVFDNEENFNNYINDPATLSLWDFITVLAENSVIVTEIVDSEQTLQF